MPDHETQVPPRAGRLLAARLTRRGAVPGPPLPAERVLIPAAPGLAEASGSPFGRRSRGGVRGARGVSVCWSPCPFWSEGGGGLGNSNPKIGSFFPHLPRGPLAPWVRLPASLPANLSVLFGMFGRLLPAPTPGHPPVFLL